MIHMKIQTRMLLICIRSSMPTQTHHYAQVCSFVQPIFAWINFPGTQHVCWLVLTTTTKIFALVSASSEEAAGPMDRYLDML